MLTHVVKSTHSDHGPLVTRASYGKAWAVSTAYEVYGVTVLVRATTSRHWDEVCRALPLYRGAELVTAPDLEYTIVWADPVDMSGHRPAHDLFRGHKCILRASHPGTLIDALQVDLARSVARAAVGRIFVHAGAVANGGHGIILPGISGSGKSTLVRQLLKHGAAYYSDEYAVLSRDGRLHPFPCRLRLGAQPESKRSFSVDQLGAVEGRETPRMGCVVFPTYEENATLSIEQIPSSNAALQLLGHMPQTRTQPAQAMETAVRATSRAQCYRVRHSNSAELAEVLLSFVKFDSTTR